MSNLLEDVELLITGIEPVIYISAFPSDSIDNICSLYLIPGRPPQHVFGQKKPAFRQPSFQVRIRDNSYQLALDRLTAIIEELDGHNGINGIMQIMAESDIIPLGKDTKDRSELICNFNALTNY